MPPVAQPWLLKLAALRVDTDSVKGRAPHKPLLLLAVLDLLEAGLLPGSRVELSAELVLRFQNFWPIVQERRGNKGDIRLPFHALSNDGVWAVFDAEDRPSHARETSISARLPEDVRLLLADAAFRAEVRRALVTRYFPATEQVALFAALGFEAPDLGALNEDPAAYVVARETGRSARFKNEVVSGYRFTCALTGYRLTTRDQAGIVEAAHIHALSSSRNNDLDNGLALTPTAHALFDLGLWSVSDDLRILVKTAPDFAETAPAGGFSLRALAGSSLHVATDERLRPHPTHLAWHRRKHGFGRG